MVASCAIAGLVVIPVGITTNWPLLMVIVTLAGLGVGGALVLAPVYDRGIPAGARSQLMLGGQVLSLGMVAIVASIPALYLLPAYPETFVLIFAGFALVLIPVIMFALPESPRWLEGKGRVGEADAYRHQTRGERSLAGTSSPRPTLPGMAFPSGKGCRSERSSAASTSTGRSCCSSYGSFSTPASTTDSIHTRAYTLSTRLQRPPALPHVPYTPGLRGPPPSG